jgi:hypothetical protein
MCIKFSTLLVSLTGNILLPDSLEDLDIENRAQHAFQNSNLRADP